MGGLGEDLIRIAGQYERVEKIKILVVNHGSYKEKMRKVTNSPCESELCQT